MKTDIDKLEYAICKAKQAAYRLTDVEDAGTCNFDTPMIEIIGCTKTEICSMDYEVEKYKGNWYFLNIALKGQAERRTRMAETMVKSLQKDNFNSRMFYQID